MLHFMTYEFKYKFIYMNNIVKSYMKSGVSRFQMPVGRTSNLGWERDIGRDTEEFRS